jgi:hypothetical protein
MFDSDFVLKNTKKSELSFFLKTKDKKRKCSIVNYRSFAITKQDILHATPNELLGNRKRIVNTMGPWVTHTMLTFRPVLCCILLLSE